MKNLLAKIWVPLVLVSLAAMQSFGIDAARNAGLRRLADSLVLSQLPDTTAIIDSIVLTSVDSTAAEIVDSVETPVLSARDTIKVPEELLLSDPFKYKYYIALKDSTTRFQVRDSLMSAGDTLELMRLDSLYVKDSMDIAKAKFDAWYASLTKMERKKYDAEQALPGLIAAAARKIEIKDSIQAYKDSVRLATPRILQTFAVPDSLHFKRIITWQHDRDFHNMIDVRDMDPDTSYIKNFNDYVFLKQDINASWLGVSGSPVQLYDWFKREDEENAIFYTPYATWSYSPETLPQYNTKTPHTELAYYGTLFANQEKEEANIRIMTTQNITPELNVTFDFRRYGGNGMLKREDTANKTFVAAANYLGKKYMMHAGYISNNIKHSENGGIIDESWIRDTIVDAREIDVYLRDASNQLKKKTLFVDQTYRIPLTFLTELKADSLKVQRDTLKLDTDITTAFIGHSSEYSVFSKTYTDKISDKNGRDFYGDRFYINPTSSFDSLRVMRFENKFFVRLQPWTDDAIVSKLDVGIGDKLVSYFNFKPVDYIQGADNVFQNSVYFYAGANGQYRNYLTWNAKGKYNFLGYEINDFGIEGNVTMNAYPFRRYRTSPLTVDVHFETTLKEPDYYQEHLFTNHFKWDNDFSKISTTRLETSVSIPRWKTGASFGYGLLSNNIYYDTQGYARQNTAPMSVMTATLRKDFQLWKIHLDHNAMLQLSSNPEVVQLPLLALNFRYYMQFDVVERVMQMQIGAVGTYTTEWYAPAYNPVLGVFHNQDENKYGNCPYIDAFVNIQWKKASIFIKAVNVNMGWPNKKADYFSAAGYIAPQRTFKFGITWPFWVRPGKSSTPGPNGAGAPGGPNAGGVRQGSANSRL